MNYDAELVEYIVREVIRRLKAEGGGAKSQIVDASKSGQCELNVTDKLVTLATLKGKLDGVKQVTVARRSIVTPAARDELNQRMIVLKRDT